MEGELLSSADANGNKTEYSYDSQNRLVKTVIPTGEEFTYVYDKEGNVTSASDANGTISKYVYDRVGNVIQQAVGNEIISYTYTSCGLIETLKRGTESTKYEYNNLNQIIKKVLQDGTKIEYTYDTSGNLTKVSTNYTSTSYSYDKLNRIVRVVNHNGKATLYEYDENGNRSTVKYANGVVATYTYDCRNRLVSAGNATYEYDAENNRIAVVVNNVRTDYVIENNAAEYSVSGIVPKANTLRQQAALCRRSPAQEMRSDWRQRA